MPASKLEPSCGAGRNTGRHSPAAAMGCPDVKAELAQCVLAHMWWLWVSLGPITQRLGLAQGKIKWECGSVYLKGQTTQHWCDSVLEMLSADAACGNVSPLRSLTGGISSAVNGCSSCSTVLMRTETFPSCPSGRSDALIAHSVIGICEFSSSDYVPVLIVCCGMIYACPSCLHPSGIRFSDSFWTSIWQWVQC